MVAAVETLAYFPLLPNPHRPSPILQTTAVANNSEGRLQRQHYTFAVEIFLSFYTPVTGNSLRKKQQMQKNRRYGTSNIATYLTEISEPHYQFSISDNVQVYLDCQLLWPNLRYRQIS